MKKTPQAQPSSNFATEMFALLFVVLAVAICRFQSVDMALLCGAGFAAMLPVLYAYKMWRQRPAVTNKQKRHYLPPASEDPDDSWIVFLATLDHNGDGVPD